MPLVAHNALPSFGRLRDRGYEVLTFEQGERLRSSGARALRIGFLNMMPDAALTATEQQFLGMVGASEQDALFYVYPIPISGLNRGCVAKEHIDHYYFGIAALMEHGLDALIITGANVTDPSLDQEPFWDPLMEIVIWAQSHVASILCSCLATHALVKFNHGIDRQHLPQKQWGVYSHEVLVPEHPLLLGTEPRFDAPHSRFNQVTRTQLEQAGLTVLVESPDIGVHMAVTADQFSGVYFQGHPEYDANSLLKEYKREVFRFLNGELDAPPPFPENYLSDEAKEIATNFVERAHRASVSDESPPEFPEDLLTPGLRNTWRNTGDIIVNNWLTGVCNTTSPDRRFRFADDIDPEDPLGIGSST